MTIKRYIVIVKVILSKFPSFHISSFYYRNYSTSSTYEGGEGEGEGGGGDKEGGGGKRWKKGAVKREIEKVTMIGEGERGEKGNGERKGGNGMKKKEEEGGGRGEGGSKKGVREGVGEEQKEGRRRQIECK